MKISDSKSMAKEEEEEEEEPVSPTGRMMQAPKFNLFIIILMGYNTKIEPSLYKKCMQQTLLKHPRFSSTLVASGGRFRWRRTAVDIDSHVFVPEVGPAAVESPDEFVADYASSLSEIPMDTAKPLWEFHILNVKTSDAEAVVVMKIHHSLGDGVSLIALTHACSRKIHDPDSLPVLPASNNPRKGGSGGAAMRLLKAVWTVVLILFYTLVDMTAFVATLLFLRDVQTPVRAGRGVKLCRKRFVHRIVSLDDVKLIKNAMNVSVNDVMIGVTEAGLSRYLNTAYEENRENGAEINEKSSNFLPRNLGIRSTVVFNLRSSPTIEDLAEMMEKEELNGMWGNIIAIVLIPFGIDLQVDPLTYIRRAKSTMDRKKLSLAHKWACVVMKLTTSMFGIKAPARMTRTVFRNTTFSFSNVMGPTEEVYLFGHHLSYIAPSVCGFPQSLIFHYQSYADKLIISIGADEKLIPNPYQLCDDLIGSLQNIKEAVIERGREKEKKNESNLAKIPK
ncbi:wax ester synthase/diacylglycerol acyltransferase 11-like [Salvia miltiorrhiza]|uniref:wax ester synthase/diacylglycerol acyltransferase 11-like n=1 Tax=Salvia miltiorrhiza TaxID=226208 RepID=UPI0025ACF64B|nr:wax ester synthase/diacylglycerol acyltransferase 11-like [Salvia miltiorrhiza]XP_057798739.1 wax ester synthase/diacylglycerol acyltransferase 11-like [Salvia miltiorrhiza]